MSDLETTQQLTRGEAADYLRQFADQLDDRPTDPLTAGLYAADGEPTDPSPSPAATDTATRGRSPEPATDDTASDATGETAPDTGSETGPDTGSETESPHRAGAETDGGADAATVSGDASAGPGSVRDGRVTIFVGNDSETVNPPTDVELSVAVGTDDAFVAPDSEQYVSFELRWDADDVDDEGLLDIE